MKRHTDLDRLQGSWNVTSLEADGRETPVEMLDGARVVVKGTRFTSVGMGARFEGLVESDQSRTPKTLDLLFTSGPQEGMRNLGIYKLANDRWTICLATHGGKRPKSFATKPGTGFALETLERAGAPRKRTKSRTRQSSQSLPAANSTPVEETPAASGAPTELEGDWAMVSGVFNGKALDQNMVQWCSRTMRANLTTVVAGPQVMLKATFNLDLSKRPSEIDYLNVANPNRGKRQAGILALTGTSLSICMAAPGEKRPADFSSKPGDGRSLTTWRLVRKT